MEEDEESVCAVNTQEFNVMLTNRVCWIVREIPLGISINEANELPVL